MRAMDARRSQEALVSPTPDTRPGAPPVDRPAPAIGEAIRPGGPPAVIAAPAPEVDVDALFTTAPSAKGWLIVLAGPPKYGKTTWCLGAPRPTWILTDRGGLKSAPDSTPRLIPESWEDIPRTLTALRDKPHKFGSIVLDTVFKAEAMLVRHLLKKDNKDSLRKVGGGYGTGQEWVAGEINRIVDLLIQLNEKGIHTIVISQTEVKTVKDAVLDDYEKTALAMSKQTALIWAAAADVNMYVQPEIKERDRIETGKDQADRVKVDFTGKSICHVRSAPGIEAGNRLFLDSPITYSWAALEIGAAEGADIREKLFAKLATLNGRARAAADFDLNAAGWSRAAALKIING